MKKFATLQEILEIYCISRRLVRDILRHYNIDCYKNEDVIYIDIKAFHKIYTSKYNPVLFSVEEKQSREVVTPTIETKINRTFLNIFTTPVDYHQKKIKKFAMNYAV